MKAFQIHGNKLSFNIHLLLMVIAGNIITMKKIVSVLLGLCALPGVANAYVDHDSAVLRVMNKAAGKVQEIVMPVGQEARFEKLYLNVRACKQTDPFQAENFLAFVEITKMSEGQIYGNWMDRNEPGANPLQNADYDVWLVRCE